MPHIGAAAAQPCPFAVTHRAPARQTCASFIVMNAMPFVSTRGLLHEIRRFHETALRIGLWHLQNLDPHALRTPSMEANGGQSSVCHPVHCSIALDPLALPGICVRNSSLSRSRAHPYSSPESHPPWACRDVLDIHCHGVLVRPRAPVGGAGAVIVLGRVHEGTARQLSCDAGQDPGIRARVLGEQAMRLRSQAVQCRIRLRATTET